MEDFNYRVVTTEELRTQGIPYDSSTSKLILNGRLFKRQLSCRKFFREAITNHCKRILRNGESCLVVEEGESLTLWRTKEPLAAEKATQSDTPDYVSGQNHVSSQNHAQGYSANGNSGSSNLVNNNVNNNGTDKHQSVLTTIEPAFLEHCQQIMTHYIGPTAEQQIRDILRQFPHLTHRQLVDQLAACIPDPQQAEEFWQQVLTRPNVPEPMNTAERTESQQASQNGYAETPVAATPIEPSSPPHQNASPQPPLKRIYRGVSY